jgi:diacylglycerol kinase family enzyme
LKHLLIANPTARSGRAKKDIEKVKEEFERRDMEYDLAITKFKDHAMEVAFNGAGSGSYDILVPLGGDGTICEVITGILRFTEGKEIPVKMGVVHIGTSPDFNRFHSIPTGIIPQVDMIEKGVSKRVDIGRARIRSLEGGEDIFYFGSSVNLGLGSDIASRSNSRYRRYLGDTLGTLLSTMVSLSTYRRSDFKGTIDEEEFHFKDVINLTVGKDPHIASGMRIPIEMKEDNGRMYCLSISGRSKLLVIANLWRMYKGDIRDYNGALFRHCREFNVVSNRNNKVEFDGDHRGFLPVRVDVIPKALEVICGG